MGVKEKTSKEEKCRGGKEKKSRGMIMGQGFRQERGLKKNGGKLIW